MGDGRSGQDYAFINGETSSTISAKRVVMYDVSANGKVKLPTATNSKLFGGVAMENITAGNAGAIRQDGMAICTAAGVVTRGDRAYIYGTAGKVHSVEANVTGTTQIFYVIGIFQESTTADGDDVEVLINVPSTEFEA